MPRPLRIEYENAFYHVMNRGKARSDIFFTDSHYEIFLNILRESCERFGCIIHAYCLMPNHYHLLMETPNANLGRVMRHVNGVYTQRFNKLQKIDGPLFRGRYKAILVETDEYLLELTKYIHKNPIEIKNKNKQLVNDLKDYKWSSYRSYLGLSSTPKWLNKDSSLSMFKDDNDLTKRYELFVDAVNNVDLEEFFKKKNREAILGKKEFKEQIYSQLSDDINKQDILKKEMRNSITADHIIKLIAKTFEVTEVSITKKANKQKRGNFPRSLAMYLCQRYKDYSLSRIAELFDLKSYRSTNYYLANAKKELEKGSYKGEMKMVNEGLNMEL
ncbi:MAG: REP element-mobilizing transposase RayT [Rickettsiales bacterium]|jgi:REP element-mobilizing transposase RayT